MHRRKNETVEECRERARIAAREYRRTHPLAMNPEERKEYWRDKLRACRAANPEQFKKYNLKHRARRIERRLAAGLPKSAAEVPAIKRARELKRKFSMTLHDYARMLENQKGCCAICGKPPYKRSLDVDHCHDNGTVRGLLCRACNLMLGHAKNDTNVIKCAIVYLNRASGQSSCPR